MSAFADITATGTSTGNRVTNAIAMASRRTGVDFAYLLGQAKIESSMNPTARATTSSATGLYQFIDQSWLAVIDQHGSQYGLGWAADAISQGSNGRYYVSDPELRQQILDLRKHPETASVMAAEHAADNKAFLEKRLGREAEPVDLYLAHFLGVGGASKFLSVHDRAPDATAASLFPSPAILAASPTFAIASPPNCRRASIAWAVPSNMLTLRSPTAQRRCSPPTMCGSKPSALNSKSMSASGPSRKPHVSPISCLPPSEGNGSSCLPTKSKRRSG